MATTALFVEIVIVGLETTAWLLALVVSFKWFRLAPTDLKDWASLLTLAILATAYVLGILVDRAADSAYGWIRRGLQRIGVCEAEQDPPAPFGEMRLWVMKESEGIARFLDYQRSRLRIARATVFNLFAAVLVALRYVWARHQGFHGMFVLVGFGGALLLGLAFVAAERIYAAHRDRLVEAYLMLRTKVVHDQVAAAVCYRRGPAGIEFLLVRTKGGKYWTFPKGHIKKKEKDRPWKAASREAREEGGVIGRVRQLPFAYFAYPSGKGEGSLRVEHRVAAYLLEVTGSPGGEEAFRHPRWCTPDEACGKLAEGDRDPRYLAELQQVVSAALEALGERR